MNSLEGVSLSMRDGSILCCIESISSEFKALLRRNLSSICHGANEAGTGRPMFCYETTLDTLLVGYNKKKDKVRVGMIGELLAHVLILHLFDDFKSVSPYFNMEEKNIKKGFDLLLYSFSSSEVWITEVKSGRLNSGKNSNQTANILLGRASRDLYTRLNEQESNYWRNAVNSARVAVEDNRDYKEVILDILRDEGDLASEGTASSDDNNVFLVATLFADISDPVAESVPHDFYLNLRATDKFQNELVFCIQKNTIEAVVDFLREEAANA
tara:strand:+ start:465 stop:1274 length:810 start_codon:yes stop_codon:yes gene_type:complete